MKHLTYFEPSTNSILNCTKLRHRYGQCPADSVLRKKGIYPLVFNKERSGNPIGITFDDLRGVYYQTFEGDDPAHQLEERLIEIRTSIDDVRQAAEVDVAEDNAVMTLLANLVTRVAALENNP